MNFKKYIYFIILILIFSPNKINGSILQKIRLHDLYFEISISDLTHKKNICNEYTNAFISLKKRDYLDSERRLQKIYNEKLSPISNLLGISLIMIKEYKLSISYFQEAIRLNPKNLNSYLNLGIVYTHFKDWNSLNKLSQLLKKNLPSTGDGLMGEGISLYHLHKLKSSNKILKRTQKIMRLNSNPRIKIVNEYLQRTNSTRRRFFNIEK